MSRTDPARLQEALTSLFERAMGDHRVAAEAQRARREFFGATGDSGQTPMREQRFAEWFLLERECVALAARPWDVFATDEPDDDSADLADSRASIYRIREASAGSVMADDLQGRDQEPIELISVGGALRDGDLMVGRIFPTGDITWTPSSAVAIYRPGAQLAAALQKDFSRLELERRLSQLELEHLLLQRHGQMTQQALDENEAGRIPTDVQPATEPGVLQPGAVRPQGRPIERIEADLQRLVGEERPTFDATVISAELGASARPGAVIGPLLDGLAFATAVDLEAARLLLFELWNAHHADGEAIGSAAVLGLDDAASDPTPAPPKHSGPLGEHLVRALDAGLAAHEDVEDLFRKLEKMAGIEPDEAEDDDDEEDERATRIVDAVAGESFGDLGPLVEEFLWETEQQESELARLLELFVELQKNAPLPHSDLEELASQDIMRVLLHVYLGAPLEGRAAAVRGTFEALRKFFEWAEETQSIAMLPVLEGCRGPLLDQLERLEAASQALSKNPVREDARPPAVLHVDDLGPDGFGVLADDEPHWIRADDATVQLLRKGDVLLGAIVPAGDSNEPVGDVMVGTVVVLPSDAESLIG